jgi:hypothetical protein
MWLDEWLEDNQVQNLAGCKAWKQSMPILGSAVIGIDTIPGGGCSECNFAHERKREITAHMRKVHNIKEQVDLIPCLLQRVFSSHLHGFWRVEAIDQEIETNDEGLLALRLFSSEVKKLEEMNTHSAVGILY